MQCIEISKMLSFQKGIEIILLDFSFFLDCIFLIFVFTLSYSFFFHFFSNFVLPFPFSISMDFLKAITIAEELKIENAQTHLVLPWPRLWSWTWKYLGVSADSKEWTP